MKIVWRNLKTNYMLIKVKKEVEETIELQTPCWVYDQDYRTYVHITTDGDVIKVMPNLIALYDRGNSMTELEIREAIQRAHSCTEAEFKEALDKQLFKLEEAVTA
jgi:hypothetical protein